MEVGREGGAVWNWSKVTLLMVVTSGPPRRAWRPGSKSRRDVKEEESSSVVFLSHGEATRAQELRELVKKSYKLMEETDRYVSPLFSHEMNRDMLDSKEDEEVEMLYEIRKESERRRGSKIEQQQGKAQVPIPAQLAISCPEMRNRLLANVEYFERKLASLEQALSRKAKGPLVSESSRQEAAGDERTWVRTGDKESSIARPLDFWGVKLEDARREACTLREDINGLLLEARELVEKQRAELTASLKKSYGRASMRREMGRQQLYQLSSDGCGDWRPVEDKNGHDCCLRKA
ncbi:hypothetical protein GUITHDRAFT_146409 [Guillardia theta CCMP2712]|uniref:Uncharacterized protein n=1 Tax=Guillardia theta (strain CCMP2712) TaxID=905079 RepID=L1IIE2_GUITC|nr:hypothetical protein GUITHDRAFT_146409 [Guillardia theta CCMP2712]EKX35585.1 hypothetical protein GUITHDRAFT_146409 [Guillardia theta CCMP2712]|eukprot:XP_005822565.1 hypothetical protein GUITHDRAFT_146409 [Guillardia theta CCMP2712]